MQPSLFKAFSPWDEITTPEALERLFECSGIGHPTVEATAGEQDLDDPDDFWDVVLGSGYRATIEALRPGQRETVRWRLLRTLS